MELTQIRHFVAVIRARSFTAAAELCGVSQPGLTKSIHALERELGGPLFHREGNRTLMTELGRTMAPVLSQMDEQAQLARRTAESFQVLKTSSIRLGIMSTIGGAKLAPWLAKFRQQYPGADVELHQSDGDDIAARLDRGELELAVMNAAQHERDRHYAELLYQERYRVAFGSGHRFEAADRVRLADLSGEPYIDRMCCELRKQFQQLCDDSDLALAPVIRSEREDWTQELVIAGLGCAVLPEFSIRHPQIRTRPLVDPEISRGVSLVRVRGRQLSNPVRKLRDLLNGMARSGTEKAAAAAH
jgi:LysR family transcriptional regulator, hydrogen peroxide-inducible genes activator